MLLGDLFTKGPDPAGVFDRVRRFDAVLGNHDLRLLDALDDRRPDDAHAHRVVATLDRSDRAWRSWLRERPLTMEVGPFVAVHAALHPSGRADRTDRRTATWLRHLPGTPRHTRWWEHYRAEQRVIFGHDALRGLVRCERKGLPWVIGLDSGCVYGGFLTGYLVEEDRLLQVRARRTYRQPG